MPYIYDVSKPIQQKTWDTVGTITRNFRQLHVQYTVH